MPEEVRVIWRRADEIEKDMKKLGIDGQAEQISRGDSPPYFSRVTFTGDDARSNVNLLHTIYT
jgi:hypothetical protein